MSKEIDDMIQIMRNQPIEFSREGNNLDALCERWTGLLRHIGYDVVKRENANNMTKPDVFDIANEISAFFKGLNARQ